MPLTLEVCLVDPEMLPLVTVQIPDNCPSCGADFHQPEALVEINYDAGRLYLHIGPDGGPDWGSYKHVDGPPIPVLHLCAACEHQLTGPPVAVGDLGAGLQTGPDQLVIRKG